ncbi:PLP-dependent transferase [Pleomassaria siparia CBS 279.74]|uniref:PLP-dependent transferase n=1 Tax=Pleomassaria siparia CBS 279.74 TaxID=1314801 RepID=A0A6G1JXL0_9PLEO|nr:PLP-dependent transferase [Pleomassaria siparia CBS 279.74]
MFRQKLSKIEEKRASSGSLPSGPAPYTCASFFKTQPSGLKPNAKSFEHRFSDDALNQNVSVLKAAAMFKGRNDMITLGTGRPAAEFYPWSSMTTHGMDKSCEEGENIVEMSCSAGESAFDLSVALNYGYAGGSPQLLRFVTEHVEMIHDPPYNDWDACLTCGTTSAIDLCFQILCNRGDCVLSEEYTYSGTIDAAKSRGLNILGVKMDDQGLSPEDLDFKLRTWDTARGRKPFVLYTIPTGHNPTGVTQSVERRHAIYEVAEAHDLLIIEDDPYCFLQLGIDTSKLKSDSDTPSPVDLYLDQLPVSYLSLDTSGRVVRLDSTSKILAPGLRCGWMTACSQIVAKFMARTEVSTVAPSGASQVMLYKLLDETWGHLGFIQWLRHLSVQYRRRRDVLVEACNRHLPSACSWIVPAEGMFLWVKVELPRHTIKESKYFGQEGSLLYSSIEDRISAHARENGVLVSKGSWFGVTHAYSSHVHFRMTFAAAPSDTLECAVRRFGDALRVVLRIE